MPSNLKIPEWRKRLSSYHDSTVCEFLEFGWPVGADLSTTPQPSRKNHGSALKEPHLIAEYIQTECQLEAAMGPFTSNPLSKSLVTSPLQIARGRSGKPRVVLDLSFPQDHSVNSAIPSHTYLGDPFHLHLPGLDGLLDIIRDKGPGCHLFKKDLRRAYRQLRIDPRDYHLLGYCHNELLYFDIAPPFGLRSAAMMCQRTTSAVSYIYRNLGFSCTNYIDDFGGAEVPSKSAEAFEALSALFATLGLEESLEKASPPSCSMVFLGISLDTLTMTMSVTHERVQELLDRCSDMLNSAWVSFSELQSLLGVMSFVTSCVKPARIFMSSLLATLRLHRSRKRIHLSRENVSDLRWWCRFLPYYNGVSIIKTSPWISDPNILSTDACLSGAGGYFQGEFFHTPFPGSILTQFGHDINILELLTVMVALKLWGPRLTGQRFVLHCDNSNAVVALNSGRSRSLPMQSCLREIWFIAAIFDFQLVAQHVPGNTNTIADHLSRWHLSPQHAASFASLTAGILTQQLVCSPDLFNFEVQL